MIEQLGRGDDTCKMFGLVLPVKYSVQNEDFAYSRKHFKCSFPQRRDAHVVGMFKIHKALFFYIFEDGILYMATNEQSNGFQQQVDLKIQFAKISSVLFEPSCGFLMIQSKSQEKEFF